MRLGSCIIMSADRSHKAELHPTDDGDGVWVAIKRVVPPQKLHGVWFLRGPMHVVRDRVYAITYPLSRHGSVSEFTPGVTDTCL